jgi:hypothetical protein
MSQSNSPISYKSYIPQKSSKDEVLIGNLAICNLHRGGVVPSNVKCNVAGNNMMGNGMGRSDWWRGRAIEEISSFLECEAVIGGDKNLRLGQTNEKRVLCWD